MTDASSTAIANIAVAVAVVFAIHAISMYAIIKLVVTKRGIIEQLSKDEKEDRPRGSVAAMSSR